MGKVKYTEEQFKQLLLEKHQGKYTLVSRFKGMYQPVLIQDKYGLLQFKQAIQILKFDADMRSALNKTQYFMNWISDIYPEIAEQITPASEYIAMKQEMLFNTRFGLVTMTPDNLIHGHAPTIRSAVNRKEYFKNQLLYLYQDFDYDFEITSTDRHNGRVALICPIHGRQLVDSDGIFLGAGCPECNKHIDKSNVLYIVNLKSETENFYKVGISYFKGDSVRRYHDYELLGYTVTELFVKEFDDFVECRNTETKLKRLIKPFLYIPKVWANNSSTECFKESLVELLINTVNQDIVSTSMETQSSLNKAGIE